MAEQLKPPPCVIDIGTAVTKTGFAGEDAPRNVFPSFVGTQSIWPNPDVYTVGNEALENRGKRGNLLIQPMENGYVTKFDKLEVLLSHVYKELGVKPEGQASILALSQGTPDDQLEQLTKLMFENFNVPALYFGEQGELSLFAEGKTTGCVVSSGESISTAIPIYKGRRIPQALRTLAVAGKQLTNYMMRMLVDRGYTFKPDPRAPFVVDIKHTLCFISEDAEMAKSSSTVSSDLKKTYELPDGNIIPVYNERFTCPEVLFDPNRIGLQEPGIHQITHAAIMACDSKIREDLFANIVLTGGNMQFDGLDQRLKKELVSLSASGTDINITMSPNCQYSAWVGGSILGSLDGFEKWLISKEEYDNVGPAIIHKTWGQTS